MLAILVITLTIPLILLMSDISRQIIRNGKVRAYTGKHRKSTQIPPIRLYQGIDGLWY